jgi:hypothetical protein
MFDWLFPPRCPCDPSAKNWVEDRLEWLADEFDDNAYNGRPIVLPTKEFFPDAYDGSKKAIRQLLDRVCGYMDVVPDLVTLKIVSKAGKIGFVNEHGDAIPEAAGTYYEGYSKSIITIDTTELDRPMELVGTLAHELAHVRLLGESRIMSDTYDNELLTDLTTVHFGLGLFLANAPRNYRSQNSRWPESDLIKPEYMTTPMFAWALAHLAWFRGEDKPTWTRFLVMAAKAEFKLAYRYLTKSGDSWYRPSRLRRSS